MTTEELVEKLVGYIKAMENVKAEEELYADDAISIEQDGATVQGKQAIIEKTKGMSNYFEALHGEDVTAAYVGADNFLLVISMDVTPKGGTRMTMTEFGYYEVKNGKISREIFYAQPRVSTRENHTLEPVSANQQ